MSGRGLRLLEGALSEVINNESLANMEASGVLAVLEGVCGSLGGGQLVSVVELIMEELKGREESGTNFRWLPLLGSLLQEAGGREVVGEGVLQEKGSEYRAAILDRVANIR